MDLNVLGSSGGKPAYRRIEVLNLGELTRTVNLSLPPCRASQVENPDGTLTICVIEPDISKCHLALGAFMDAWSILEIQVSIIFKRVTEIEQQHLPLLLNSMNSRSVSEVIVNFGALILEKDSQDRLIALMERLRNANSRRNHIVHGHWMLSIVVAEFAGNVKHKIIPFREYDPGSVDAARAVRDHKNKAARNKFIFSVPRLNQLTSELFLLENAFIQFHKDLFGA